MILQLPSSQVSTSDSLKVKFPTKLASMNLCERTAISRKFLFYMRETTGNHQITKFYFLQLFHFDTDLQTQIKSLLFNMIFSRSMSCSASVHFYKGVALYFHTDKNLMSKKPDG